MCSLKLKTMKKCRYCAGTCTYKQVVHDVITEINGKVQFVNKTLWAWICKNCEQENPPTQRKKKPPPKSNQKNRKK